MDIDMDTNFMDASTVWSASSHSSASSTSPLHQTGMHGRSPAARQESSTRGRPAALRRRPQSPDQEPESHTWMHSSSSSTSSDGTQRKRSLAAHGTACSSPEVWHTAKKNVPWLPRSPSLMKLHQTPPRHEGQRAGALPVGCSKRAPSAASPQSRGKEWAESKRVGRVAKRSVSPTVAPRASISPGKAQRQVLTQSGRRMFVMSPQRSFSDRSYSAPQSPPHVQGVREVSLTAFGTQSCAELRTERAWSVESPHKLCQTPSSPQPHNKGRKESPSKLLASVRWLDSPSTSAPQEQREQREQNLTTTQFPAWYADLVKVEDFPSVSGAYVSGNTNPPAQPHRQDMPNDVVMLHTHDSPDDDVMHPASESNHNLHRHPAPRPAVDEDDDSLELSRSNEHAEASARYEGSPRRHHVQEESYLGQPMHQTLCSQPLSEVKSLSPQGFRSDSMSRARTHTVLKSCGVTSMDQSFNKNLLSEESTVQYMLSSDHSTGKRVHWISELGSKSPTMDVSVGSVTTVMAKNHYARWLLVRSWMDRHLCSKSMHAWQLCALACLRSLAFNMRAGWLVWRKNVAALSARRRLAVYVISRRLSLSNSFELWMNLISGRQDQACSPGNVVGAVRQNSSRSKSLQPVRSALARAMLKVFLKRVAVHWRHQIVIQQYTREKLQDRWFKQAVHAIHAWLAQVTSSRAAAAVVAWKASEQAERIHQCVVRYWRAFACLSAIQRQSMLVRVFHKLQRHRKNRSYHMKFLRAMQQRRRLSAQRQAFTRISQWFSLEVFRKIESDKLNGRLARRLIATCLNYWQLDSWRLQRISRLREELRRHLCLSVLEGWSEQVRSGWRFEILETRLVELVHYRCLLTTCATWRQRSLSQRKLRKRQRLQILSKISVMVDIWSRFVTKARVYRHRIYIIGRKMNVRLKAMSFCQLIKWHALRTAQAVKRFRSMVLTRNLLSDAYRRLKLYCAQRRFDRRVSLNLRKRNEFTRKTQLVRRWREQHRHLQFQERVVTALCFANICGRALGAWVQSHGAMLELQNALLRLQARQSSVLAQHALHAWTRMLRSRFRHQRFASCFARWFQHAVLAAALKQCLRTWSYRVLISASRKRAIFHIRRARVLIDAWVKSVFFIRWALQIEVGFRQRRLLLGLMENAFGAFKSVSATCKTARNKAQKISTSKRQFGEHQALLAWRRTGGSRGARTKLQQLRQNQLQGIMTCLLQEWSETTSRVWVIRQRYGGWARRRIMQIAWRRAICLWHVKMRKGYLRVLSSVSLRCQKAKLWGLEKLPVRMLVRAWYHTVHRLREGLLLFSHKLVIQTTHRLVGKAMRQWHVRTQQVLKFSRAKHSICLQKAVLRAAQHHLMLENENANLPFSHSEGETLTGPGFSFKAGKLELQKQGRP